MKRAKRKSTLDRLVELRDQGICALCGLDCEEVERSLAHLFLRSEPPHIAYRAFKSSIYLKNRDRCWDADHILPVCRGGGEHLENYRTLCVWCHLKETSRLASERKAERWRRTCEFSM
jgi:5-methylcytosine-specific restriction endonuclease McrA